MISLAITHHNRFELLKQSFVHVQDDPRISEIVISDDASDDGSYQMIVNEYWKEPKFRIFRNDENLDSYINKARAVGLCHESFVILLDSDNVITPAYLDALFLIAPWDPRTIYLPVFGEPEFDYRALSGFMITRNNVAEFMEDESFKTALNMGNYVVPRYEYLECWDSKATPHTSEPIYHNFCWLEAGNKLMFVPEMTYFHRMHEGSHFVQNDHLTGEFARKVETLLKMLR